MNTHSKKIHAPVDEKNGELSRGLALNHEDVESTNSIVRLWYQLTSPPPVSANASLREREQVRRGRLASLVLLIVIVGMFVSLIAALATGNMGLLINMLVSIALMLITIWLNRIGRINLAGLIVLTLLTLNTAMATFVDPHGMDVTLLPLFDLMVQGELVAVSLLPAETVFAVASVNIALFWVVMNFAPRTTEMTTLLSERGAASILSAPIILQLIVAVVTYLWVRSTTQAIRRADRAEEVAKLEHMLAQQNEEVVAQKALLEEGILQLVQTHVQAANGNLNTRAALPQDRSLWPLAGSLNTLLARLQKAFQSEHDLQQERAAASAFMEALRRAQGGPILWQKSNTYFDQIVQQYNLHHRERF